ncbi:hypothetical protein YPPY58_1815, partial [Yersinia pestis PY-58]
MVYFAVNYNK